MQDLEKVAGRVWADAQALRRVIVGVYVTNPQIVVPSAEDLGVGETACSRARAGHGHPANRLRSLWEVAEVGAHVGDGEG